MGKRQDFEGFYADSKDRCLRALLATVADREEADDLLSEAFTRAWKQWRAVSDHPSPEAWLMRTALNLHRDRWRRANHAKRFLAVRREQLSLPDEPFDPAVLAGLRSLSDRQRSVVALRILLDLSTEQTADILGISPGTVPTHLKRGLAALRAVFSPEGSYVE
ncbi:MAG: sigma-70 family RNA polymerase sigma factor [Acidimicrobiia bacterium]|jgi:RNA polymerase sigma factor (sigma-70 family)|nr:sigma-70 family RNA polymerase sigma factor [Acidimicrobiia bacterium]